MVNSGIKDVRITAPQNMNLTKYICLISLDSSIAFSLVTSKRDLVDEGSQSSRSW